MLYFGNWKQCIWQLYTTGYSSSPCKTVVADIGKQENWRQNTRLYFNHDHEWKKLKESCLYCDHDHYEYRRRAPQGRIFFEKHEKKSSHHTHHHLLSFGVWWKALGGEVISSKEKSIDFQNHDHLNHKTVVCEHASSSSFSSSCCCHTPYNNLHLQTKTGVPCVVPRPPATTTSTCKQRLGSRVLFQGPPTTTSTYKQRLGHRVLFQGPPLQQFHLQTKTGAPCVVPRPPPHNNLHLQTTCVVVTLHC